MDTLHVLYLLFGFVLLIGGAEWLVRGAAALAVTMGISPLVVGLTVVAFGTSAPELGVSLLSSFEGRSGIAVGNIVGSNMCNVLLILGLAALMRPLPISRRLIRLDVPLMIGAAAAMWIMALDGMYGRIDGIILFGALLILTSATTFAPFAKTIKAPASNKPPRRLHRNRLNKALPGTCCWSSSA